MDDERTLSDKLSGRFRHPEDAGGKKILRGKVLRATVGRGRIAGIELPAVKNGIVSVVSRDIPGANRISFGGSTVSFLCGRDLAWKGQPILLAAGVDGEELEDWMSGIVLDIREDDEEEPKKTLYLREKGKPSEGFSSAFQVVEEYFSVPGQILSKDAYSITCLKDGGTYSIHAATSWPGAIRRSVSRVLKVSRDNVRVRPYPVKPGSNSEMWETAVEAGHAALLSWASKKSVRMDYLPSGAPERGSGTPEADFHIRGAVDSEGRILAMEGEISIRAGTAFPLEEEFVDRVMMGLFSIYPCRNYSISIRILHRETAPSSIGPGAGFELGFLAGELFITRVAELSLMHPGSWRKEFFPVSGQAYGPGLALPKDFPMPEILESVLQMSDFERKHASFEQTRLGRQSLAATPDEYRGIGLSCAWFGNGFIGWPKELGSASVSITLDKEGILSIDVPAHTAEGALRRAWAGMAGEILGIDLASVRFASELLPGNMDPGPSILGRNVSVYTKLIEQACNDLSKRRFRDALPITAVRNRRRSSRKPWSPEIYEGAPFETISWGAGVMEVSYSIRTGRIKPLRLWMVIDGGYILMPRHAHSAVEASTERALCSCLDAPLRGESPIMDISFHKTQTRKGPKDISTLPWLLIPAAFVQASRQASGSEIHSIPVQRDQLKTGRKCR